MLIGGTGATALHHCHWDAPYPSNRPLASAGVHRRSLAFTGCHQPEPGKFPHTLVPRSTSITHQGVSRDHSFHPSTDASTPLRSNATSWTTQGNREKPRNCPLQLSALLLVYCVHRPKAYSSHVQRQAQRLLRWCLQGSWWRGSGENKTTGACRWD